MSIEKPEQKPVDKVVKEVVKKLDSVEELARRKEQEKADNGYHSLSGPNNQGWC